MGRSDRAVWKDDQFNSCEVCRYCDGVVNQHALWCPLVNPNTNYAYEIVRDPLSLTEWDRLSLHSLGVLWPR